MTDTYYDDRPVKRRTLALVALLALCMVSLTSVAYAYSTTVTINNNPIDDNYYTIDYTNASGESIFVPLGVVADDEIVITTVSTVDAETGDKVVTAKINANDAITREFYVTLNADSDAEVNKNFTLDVAVDFDDIFDQFVELGTYTLKHANNSVVNNDVKVGETIKITLTLVVIEKSLSPSAVTGLPSVDNVDTADDLDAVKAILDDCVFGVTVSASPA